MGNMVVDAALKQVGDKVNAAQEAIGSTSPTHRKVVVDRAIEAVKVLEQALKVVR